VIYKVCSAYDFSYNFLIFLSLQMAFYFPQIIMVGHLQPQKCAIPPTYQSQYWLAYCSICASLRNTQGLAYGLVLNNEMTLVLLAFYPYWATSQTEKTTTLCPAKFFLGQKNIQQHPAIHLASQFSILLAWLKATDSQTDQPSIAKKYVLKTLTAKVKAMNIQLSADLENVLADYLVAIQSNDKDFQKVQRLSANLAQQIAIAIGRTLVVPEEEVLAWGTFFGKIGEMIAIADHLIDLQQDIIQNQYNPIIDHAKTQGISLLHAYQHFNKLLRINQQELLAMNIYQTHSPILSTMLPSLLQQVGKQVRKNAPRWFINPENPQITPMMQTAECDCGGCDCCDCCDCGCSTPKRKNGKSYCCIENYCDSCFGCDNQEGRPCWDSKRKDSCWS
jgi:hypothetical protein